MNTIAVPGPAPHSSAVPTPSHSRSLYRNVWRYATGARIKMLASMGLLAGSQIVKLAAPWFAAQAINVLQQNGPDAFTRAAGYVALVILAFLLSWALHGPGRVLEREVGMQVRRSLSDALYAKLLRLPVSWHDRNHSGDVQLRVGQATGALHGFAQSQFVYLQSVVNLVGPLIALTLFSGTLGAMAIVGYLGVGYLVLRFDGALMRLAHDENVAERRYQAGMLDFLGNVSTILSLRLGESTRELLRARLGAVFVPLRKSILLTEVRWCSVDMLSVVITWALVVAFVVMSGRSGEGLLMGSIFLVYQYAQQAGNVIGSIAGNFQGLARARADFASAEPIWSAQEQADPGVAIDPQWCRIDVRNLCYEHPLASGAAAGTGTGSSAGSGTGSSTSSATNTGAGAGAGDNMAESGMGRRPGGLHHVGLTLERGERIALVGPSGSGKSTLMRVLVGLYAPDERCIEVDGVPQLGTRHLGSVSTLIPQEADVFEATVRENITFGSPADDSEVLEAIRVSCFDSVMADMPQGLDTPIKERGFNLSGGQRQRLSLARGVLAARSSSLVFLDEPTSALDPVTEDVVLERMSQAFKDACLVASVHRMSLLRHFTKVVLMAGGRIEDVGTVSELCERQPAFRQMLRQSDDAEHTGRGVQADLRAGDLAAA